MSLVQLISEIEQNVGLFSTYQTISGHGQNIPFKLKPAQQFLKGLGVIEEQKPLSKLLFNGFLTDLPQPSVIINSFAPSKVSTELVITGKRISRLLNSAKTYVNNDLISKELFEKAILDNQITPQDTSISVDSKIHWQNMAVGICHVQEIDLLTEQLIQGEKALNSPRSGIIEVDAPAVLLLSSPALNFSYGMARYLSQIQRQEFIAGMYRNLFKATLNEGREYIALPAAGLGVFGGDANLYFNTLMNVAKEFPKLNIIYHPAQFVASFDTALQLYQPKNVVRAKKDVLLIANELTYKGYPCAFHNPSDCDVVFGVYDVGEYWKTGSGGSYVGEEHIGVMTTAPLNSRGLNPLAYERVIGQSFVKNENFEEKESTVNTPLLNSVEILPVSNSDYSKKSGSNNRNKHGNTHTLQQILTTLIGNISEKKGGRETWFNNNSDAKVANLTAISDWLSNQENITPIKQELVLVLIREVCAIKRNTWGIFKPHSLSEFDSLKLKVPDTISFDTKLLALLKPGGNSDEIIEDMLFEKFSTHYNQKI
ncbi:MAG: hypothetical protein H0T84_15305 [Tatlockia sp.]|nr:hypothetical protein [Tatlockia sp.]